MFFTPMPQPPWFAGPILHPAMPREPPRDPTVSVKLYSWSTEEFREENALVYTSRSHPSHTCISHWRANRDKLLFTLQDSLCVGNPVRVEMEIQAERDHRGFYVMHSYEVRKRSGKFIEQTDEPEECVTRYRDTYHHREGELEYETMELNEADIDFTTGLAGGPGLTYTINIHCHPWKGIDVNLDGPECYFGDPLIPQSSIGYCFVEYVAGKPPRNVLEKISNLKDEKKGNNMHGASCASSSSTQSSAILNAGKTQGDLNGSNFHGCNFHFARLTEEIQGLKI